MPSLSSLVQTKKIELNGDAFIVIKECSLEDNQLFEKSLFSMLRERSDLLKAEGLDPAIKDAEVTAGILEKLKPIYEKREAAFASHFTRVLPKVICDHNFTGRGQKKATNEEVAKAILESSLIGARVMEEVTSFFSQIVTDRVMERAEKKMAEEKNAEQEES